MKTYHNTVLENNIPASIFYREGHYLVTSRSWKRSSTISHSDRGSDFSREEMCLFGDTSWSHFCRYFWKFRRSHSWKCRWSTFWKCRRSVCDIAELTYMWLHMLEEDTWKSLLNKKS